MDSYEKIVSKNMKGINMSATEMAMKNLTEISSTITRMNIEPSITRQMRELGESINLTSMSATEIAMKNLAGLSSTIARMNIEPSITRKSRELSKSINTKNIYCVIIFICMLLSINNIVMLISSKSESKIEQKVEYDFEKVFYNINHWMDLSKIMITNNYKNINKFCSNNPILYDIIKTLLVEMVVIIKKLLKNNNKKSKLKIIIKLICKQIIKISDNPLNMDIVYKFLRIVNKTELEVRISDSMKAPIIYKLHYKDLVKINKQKGSWSMIEFKGEDENTYMGWVLTRYLEKFKYAN